MYPCFSATSSNISLVAELCRALLLIENEYCYLVQVRREAAQKLQDTTLKDLSLSLLPNTSSPWRHVAVAASCFLDAVLSKNREAGQN